MLALFYKNEKPFSFLNSIVFNIELKEYIYQIKENV